MPNGNGNTPTTGQRVVEKLIYVDRPTVPELSPIWWFLITSGITYLLRYFFGTSHFPLIVTFVITGFGVYLFHRIAMYYFRGKDFLEKKGISYQTMWPRTNQGYLKLLTMFSILIIILLLSGWNYSHMQGFINSAYNWFSDNSVLRGISDELSSNSSSLSDSGPSPASNLALPMILKACEDEGLTALGCAEAFNIPVDQVISLDGGDESSTLEADSQPQPSEQPSKAVSSAQELLKAIESGTIMQFDKNSMKKCWDCGNLITGEGRLPIDCNPGLPTLQGNHPTKGKVLSYSCLTTARDEATRIVDDAN